MTEKKRTGLMYSEEFNEHNPCAGALLFPAAYNKWLEQDDYYDNPKRLRPTYRLLVRSGSRPSRCVWPRRRSCSISIRRPIWKN